MLKKYFQDMFAKFDSGGSPVSWNWFAAIFQLFWYMAKGMWLKLLLYLAIWWALEKVLVSLDLVTLNSFLWFGTFAYFGAFANYDYYLHQCKSEQFWPNVPFSKYRIPLVIVIVVFVLYGLVFSGYNSVKAMTGFISAKPGAVKSFVNDGIRFDYIPAQWVIYNNPPASFSLSVSRPVGPHSSESLKCASFPGTKFMGYIQEERGEEKVSKGLISLIENKPGFFTKFNVVRDDGLVSKAKFYVGAQALPFFMKWLTRWISTAPAPVEYVNFAGRQWGCVKNTMEINLGSNKLAFYMNVYWTVADGKSVYVISEAFEPYKDDVDAQVGSFLTSFGIEKFR